MNKRFYVLLFKNSFYFFLLLAVCFSLATPVNAQLVNHKELANLNGENIFPQSEIIETGKISIWEIGVFDKQFKEFSNFRNITNFWVQNNTSMDFPSQIWGPDELQDVLGTAGDPNDNNPLHIYFPLSAGLARMSHILQIGLVRTYGSVRLRISLNDQEISVHQLQDINNACLNITLPVSHLEGDNNLTIQLSQGESVIFDALALLVTFQPEIYKTPHLKVAFIRPSWYPPRHSENLVTQTYQQLVKNTSLFGSVEIDLDFQSFGTREVTLDTLQAFQPDVLVLSYHKLFELPHFLSDEEINAIITYCQQGHTLLGIGNLFASEPEVLGNHAINALKPVFGLKSDISLVYSDQNTIDEFNSTTNHPIFSVFNSSKFYSPIQQYIPDFPFSVYPVNTTWQEGILPNVTLISSQNQKGALILNNYATLDSIKAAYCSFFVDYQEFESIPDLDLQILYNTLVWLSPHPLLSGSLTVITNANASTPSSLIINQSFRATITVKVTNWSFEDINVSSAFLERNPAIIPPRINLLYFSPDDKISRLVNPYLILKPGENISSDYPIVSITDVGFASLILNFTGLDSLNHSTNTAVELHFLSLPDFTQINLGPSSFTLNTVLDTFNMDFSASLVPTLATKTQKYIIEYLNSSSEENYVNTTMRSLEIIVPPNVNQLFGATLYDIEISFNAPRNTLISSLVFLEIIWQYQSLDISIAYFSDLITIIYGQNNYEDYYIPLFEPPYFSTSVSFAVVITWIFGVFMSRRELKNSKRLFEGISQVIKSGTGQKYLREILKIDKSSELSLKINIRRISTLFIFWMATGLLIIIGLQSTATVFDFWLLKEIFFDIFNTVFGSFLILVIIYFLWIRPKPRANDIEKIHHVLHNMVLHDLVTKSIDEKEYTTLKHELDLLKSLHVFSEIKDDKLKLRESE
ncbi:MAG: polysaccharide lyase family protein [Candidatus Hermodarchaeota archaeon]